MNCIPDIKNKKLIYNTDDEENLYSSNFENLNYERLLNIIRTDLYELIVRRNELKTAKAEQTLNELQNTMSTAPVLNKDAI